MLLNLSECCEMTPTYCDVTLVSEGNQQIKVHKVILAVSSPFFTEMLRSNKHSHPLIYMSGVKTKDISALVDFIYHGEALLPPPSSPLIRPVSLSPAPTPSQDLLN